jgi:hypothetical protein
LEVTSDAKVGARDLTITNSAGVSAKATGVFSVVQPAPVPAAFTVTSLTPTSVSQGKTVTVQLGGTGLTTGLTLTIAPYALGARVDGIVVAADGKSLTFNATASDTATLGWRDLVVKLSNGSSATLTHAFEVTAKPPAPDPLYLQSLSVSSVTAGQVVATTLVGTGLTSGMTVTLPNASGVSVESLVVAADGKSAAFNLVAASTATAGACDLVVTTASATASLAHAFDVVAAPVVPPPTPLTLSSLAATSVKAGQTVSTTLTGSGFTSGLTLTLAPSALGVRVENVVVAADGKSVAFNLIASSTATLGGRDLVVTTASGATATLAHAFDVLAATVTPPAAETLSAQSLAVTSLAVGQTMTTRLTGTGFSSGTTFVVGPSALGVTIVTKTWIDSHTWELTLRASSTARIGGRDLTLTNPDGATVTLASALTVVAP